MNQISRNSCKKVAKLNEKIKIRSLEWSDGAFAVLANVAVDGVDFKLCFQFNTQIPGALPYDSGCIPTFTDMSGADDAGLFFEALEEICAGADWELTNLYSAAQEVYISNLEVKMEEEEEEEEED